MTYGSLFAGAGGADLGLDAAGFECRWQVEIDRQARSVLRRRWPNVPKQNDVRQCGKHNLERVDMIVGGSPCQGFSVAGNRGGTADERSGLFGEQVRIVDELQPEYVWWENVPGVFSGYDEATKDDNTELLAWAAGRTPAVEIFGPVWRRWMGAVLRSFSNIGYVGAWRILNARHFGVPQRRRRVFALFTRRTGDGFGAKHCAEILAFACGVRGDSATSQETGKDVAGPLGAGTPGSSFQVDTDRATFIATAEGGRGDIFLTRTNVGKGVNNQTPLLVSQTLNASSGGDEDSQNAVIAFGCKEYAQDATEGIAPTLRAMSHNDIKPNGGGQLTIFQTRVAKNGRGAPTDHCPALSAADAGVHSDSKPHVFGGNQAVRRLTPRECERLMGWPDDHTRHGIDDDGVEVELADGPRYRMCGNGIVSKLMKTLGERLKERA